MATEYYSLPTINGADTIDGVNAINGLANATDAALRGVANSIPSLDSVNSQLATLSQQVGTATTTANAAASAASSANNNANSALSTANNAQTSVNQISTNLTPTLETGSAQGTTLGFSAGSVAWSIATCEAAHLHIIKVQTFSLQVPASKFASYTQLFNLPEGSYPTDNFRVLAGSLSSTGAYASLEMYVRIETNGAVSLNFHPTGTPSEEHFTFDGTIFIPMFYGFES